MRSLPPRIADALDDDRDAEARARRLARRIARRPVRGSRPAWIAGALVAAAIVAAVVVLSRPTPSPAPTLPEAGALAAGRHDLADGSWVIVSPGTRATLVASSAERLEILLEAGRVELEVRPGGARRFEVETGLANVSVVGTHFAVMRTEAVVVEVTRGTVLVRGEHVPGRARLVHAGESLTVEEPPPPPPPSAEAPAEAREVAASRAPTAAAPSPWRELAEAGEYDEAWTALGEDGLRRRVRSAAASDLLSLADVARRSGHPEEAVAPLERLLESFPEDPDAALGAFTLGRLHADALGHPDRAAAAFERALSLHLPAALVPDATARLALAHEASGAHGEAVAAARRYLEAHPDAPRAAEMRRLVEER